jgi:DNA polymerase-3 subunit gamma/tau
MPEYRVLARKYRPDTFADMIGQEALVRTLSNAIAQDRLAHAFIFTGVRGIGKTTTARILARVMNCTGPDGQQDKPTVTPCGVCDNCVAIRDDRHVDVLEMDAASRTGVDDIRELIEGVRYKPVSSRFKVYIIDEVHMLSRNAFNALLKTLEEPPAHVKFIFATTDIHKVPVTVLSRCQRFDLPRVGRDLLARHLQNVATQEAVTLADEAALLLARAAEGSVRDGLSLLDRAIALAGDAPVAPPVVQEMLGLSERTDLFALFRLVMQGDTPGALERLNQLYTRGAEPLAVLRELQEITHLVTRAKVDPATLDLPSLTELERTESRDLAAGLGVPVLTRAWQILLKGCEEVQATDLALPAVEMVLIRLCYLVDLPPPGELLKALGNASPTSNPPAASATGQIRPEPGGASASGGVPAATGRTATAAPAVVAFSAPEAAPAPESFEAVVALFEARREGLLAFHLKRHARLASFTQGAIEIALTPEALPELAGKSAKLLSQWTRTRWTVTVVNQAPATAATLQEQRITAKRQELEQYFDHPVVKAVLEAFPNPDIVLENL